MSECSIKIYTLSTCGHCKNTKKLLDECGVAYECIEVDKLEGDARDSVLGDVKKVNLDCSFPTIMIGGKIIVGYREREIREAITQ
jgi:glutaredoxin-like protein NrdH